MMNKYSGSLLTLFKSLLILSALSTPLTFAHTPLDVPTLESLRAITKAYPMDQTRKELAQIILKLEQRYCQTVDLNKRRGDGSLDFRQRPLDSFIQRALPDGKTLTQDIALAKRLIKEYKAGDVELDFKRKLHTQTEKSPIQRADATSIGLVCQYLGQGLILNSQRPGDIINLARSSKSVADILSESTTRMVSGAKSESSANRDCFSISKFPEGSTTKAIHATCLSFKGFGGDGISQKDLERILSDPELQSRVTRIELGSPSYSDRIKLSEKTLKSLTEFKKLREIDFRQIDIKDTDLRTFIETTRDRLRRLEFEGVDVGLGLASTT